MVVDFALPPGQMTETVMVTGEPPTLQTQDASVGQVINARTINDLPLNGRNFTFLAQLAAGVTQGQQDTRGLGASGSFAANGQRPAQNNYLLDGIDNNANLVDFLNGTAFAVRPPVDAIQEFKIQTNDYSAEFGRSAGAILNATIKSGTNQFHGNAWEFLRNDALDAANFFENSGGIPKGEYRQNQFGFTIGGPIKKDKTFFFGDYEGTRIRQAHEFDQHGSHCARAQQWIHQSFRVAHPGRYANRCAGANLCARASFRSIDDARCHLRSGRPGFGHDCSVRWHACRKPSGLCARAVFREISFRKPAGP